MAKPHDEAPAVTAFSDHEIIVPPNKLKKAVTKAFPGTPEDDPVARAEAALAGLSHEFAAWMASECERLDRARRKILASGFTGVTHDELFRAAHDIRGGAETYGFPHAGEVADSLCRLIEHTPEREKIPMALVEQHVDAIRAIIRERETADAGKIAAVLAERLRQVTDEFLARENRDRPGALDGIVAPPLAPGA
jgi:HPt (histidine-containing phosphotransfer) domain-containing protein